MAYTIVALKEKIIEMFPEISQHNISVGLTFDEQKNAYILKFNKENQELSTHLDKKDADDCMNNIKCIYLGAQISEFIKNYELRK